MTDHESAVRRLRAANPVPVIAVLPADDLAAVWALLDRRRGKMAVSQTAPLHRWHRPVFALAAAFVLTLAGVGTTLLFARGGEEAPPIATATTIPAPTTTLPVTTTAPPATTTAEGTPSAAAWSYPPEAVPPFHATIAWDRNPESTWRIGYLGSTATVDVWYEAPLRFRWQLIELDTDLAAQGVPGAGQHMGGPGSYLVGDGEAMGQYRAADPSWVELDAGHYLAWMFWEPEPPGGMFDWAGECRDHSSEPTREAVAGRDTYHIACSTLRGDWELWVDAQTGLILKMLGETEIDDQVLGTSPEGGFEVALIDFLEAPIAGSDTLFAVVAPDDVPPPPPPPDVPPLHAIWTRTSGDQPWTEVREIWYRSAEQWRDDILSSDYPADPPGHYEICSDGVHTLLWPTREGYVNVYSTSVCDERDQAPGIGHLTDADTFGECADVGIEVIAGRSALHTSCSLEASTLDFWTDLDIGWRLKGITHIEDPPGYVEEYAWALVSLEIEPVFPEGIFTVTPEPDWCNVNDMANCTRGTWDGTGLSRGTLVPTFSGPLADGTEFDLTELRGQPVIVFLFFWGGNPEQEPMVEEFEALYQKWGDRVAFVTVPNAWDTDVRRLVARVPLTHLVVTCSAAPPLPEGQQSSLLCSPDSPEQLWGVGGPAWLMIDAEGRALDLRRGIDTTYEALDAMIAAAVGE